MVQAWGMWPNGVAGGSHERGNVRRHDAVVVEAGVPTGDGAGLRDGYTSARAGVLIRGR